MEKSHMEENTAIRWITGIAKAQLLFLLTGVLLLLVFCLIAWKTEDPSAVMAPLSQSALCLAALSGGIGAVRFTGDGLLSGLLAGTVSAGLIRMLALLPLPASGLETSSLILFTCLLPILSLCGAVLGKRRKKKMHPIRRH